MKIVNRFVFNITNLRKANRYTQKHVAKQIGMTNRQYSYLECGHFNCKYENIICLCKLYSVSADELFGIEKMLIYPEMG